MLCIGSIKFFLLCTLSLLLLVACGGGGSSSDNSKDTPPPAPLPQPPAPIISVTPFPRASPEVIILPDDPEYATRKASFEASNEYEVRYQVIYSDGRTERGSDSHLGAIKAAAAYARGATGKGETIAIFDTGIRRTHQEFSGSDKLIQFGIVNDLADKSHGTAVAAVAAARRGNTLSRLNMHGVAFDARIAFRDIPIGIPDGTYRPVNLTTYQENRGFFSQLIDYAKEHNAAIINASFGENGAISTYNPVEVRSKFTDSATVLAQENTADADKKIIVWAAGNGGSQGLVGGGRPIYDSPEIYAGLGVYFPELQKNTIAVVALDQDGNIASYSNRCGIAKGFCIAAPGTRIITASGEHNNEYILGRGTSFAAPIVSGSLAVLRQFFRHPNTNEVQLGNTELVARLLATANHEGRYANSDIYGHGLVDLDAATRPVGELMTGLHKDSNSRPFSSNGITLFGGAFGSLLEHQLADIKVAGFDSFGAPFFQPATAWITPTQEQKSIESVAQKPLSASFYQNDTTYLSLSANGDGRITDAYLSFTDGWWFSYGHHARELFDLYDELFINSFNSVSNLTSLAIKNRYGGIVGVQNFSDPLAFSTPYLSLVHNGVGIGRSHSLPESKHFGFALMRGTPQFDGQKSPGGEHGLGVLLDYRLSTSGLSFQAGVVHEPESFLGARIHAIFGKVAALTRFIGVNGIWDLGTKDSWHMLASVYHGHTYPQIDSSGFLQNASTILSSAFSIGVISTSIWQDNDWFGLRLSQPLRTESGSIKLRFPTGRTKYGKVVYENHKVSLDPNGRTLQAETIYRLPLAGGVLKTSIGAEYNPKHDSKRDTQPFMRLSFRGSF